MKKQEFTPEFLYIPYLIMNLQPADRFVFGAIYYFEKMKDGKCFASNEEIARIAKIAPRSVANSLNTLEKEGFIKRIFNDKNHRNRKEIKCLIKLRKDTPTNDTPTNDTFTNDKDTPTDDKDTPVGEQISKSISKNISKILPPQAVEDKIDINKYIELFKEVNPSYKRLYAMKGQRAAVERLVKEYGGEKLEAMIGSLLKVNKIAYMPTTITPYELEGNIGKIKARMEQQKGRNNLGVIKV